MSDDARYVEVIEFRRGEAIFREGDPGGCMFLIQSGRIGIYTNYGTDEETLLTELNEGSFFGEMGMVRGFPRSATAVALENHTGVITVTWPTLGNYFKESPAKIVAIMQQMANRIGELSDNYIEACGVVTELLDEHNQIVSTYSKLHKYTSNLEEQLLRNGKSIQRTPAEVRWQSFLDSKDPHDPKYRKFVDTYTKHRSPRP